ncbi:hypothetical protein EIP91_010254 [Steccherinum ochraceum]|uniref:Probable RNA-binding protein 18 n=1 Tax=Steccherinum ochraceum TaxID=92696 RepID=A0A4R0R3D9_9APHY|nr:hypothetical protein EIP91_010254 [Steccherinum ochraceum]
MMDESAMPSSSSSGSTPRARSPPVTTTTANDHLSFPSVEVPERVSVPQQSAQPKQLLKDRLYVGNLHSTVDEYTLLQVFQKYGKISKMDFLFHKAGPMKGKPRGYAFVEYSDPTDADRALVSANDKLLRGRKLVVTYAHQAPMSDLAGGGGARGRRVYNDMGKPTTLSLLKSSANGRANATGDKIAKMEAKLRQMEQASAAAGPSSSSNGGGVASSSSSSSAMARPPSLPPKPLVLSEHHTHLLPAPSSNNTSRRGKARAGPPLPSLPLSPSQPPAQNDYGASVPVPGMSSGSGSGPKKLLAGTKKGSALVGVKIVKHRDK